MIRVAEAIVISVSILLALAFFFTEKSLHKLELVFLGMSSFFVHSSFSFLVIINYKLLEVSQDIPAFLANEVFRLTVVPISIVWLLDAMERARSLLRKGFNAAVFVIVVLTFDFMLDAFGIVVFSESWSLWRSAVLWLGVVLLMLIIKNRYRAVLRRELSQ